MLNRGGAHVVLAGFVRGDRLHPDIADRQPLVLGKTNDAALIRRAGAALGAATFNRRLKKAFVGCEAIVARNLEQLAIARFVAGGRPLIYECLDIHRTLLGRSLASKAIRGIEGRLLPRVDLLVTSSPAFVRNHYAHRQLSAPVLLVENKLLAEGATRFATPPPLGPPWRIGWFGMLRCRRTLHFLTELVLAADGTIEVLISGKPSPAELPDLSRHVAEVPGMRFTGPYAYDELADLYGQVHFAWTIDWFEEGQNSSWLLPNRIYEAIAHRAVPIALADIEVGRWLAAHDAGLLVTDPLEARSRLLSMSGGEFRALSGRVAVADRADVVVSDAECTQLVEAIAGASR